MGQLAEPNAGSTTRHPYPPPSPTNVFPSLFKTNIGYAGPTPTGGEAGLVQTAPLYPMQTFAANLVEPKKFAKAGGHEDEEVEGEKERFYLFKKWGNLSPWYSVPSKNFGLKHASANVPDGCKVDGLHLLHRHGARYPTGYSSYGGPANFATRLRAANNERSWTGSGKLEFLNNWTYKLGEEVLTPFGRQQLYDLGVSMRMKYGFLLEDFTKRGALPVFRTESQDRMLKSAKNFALGFFGWPTENQYQEVVTIEASGFNNTLAPYMNCPNAKNLGKSDRGTYYLKKWAQVYLKDTKERLNKQMEGYEFSVEDVYSMQQTCAYETVAIGYSAFCGLFTEEEWEGFAYATDIFFWYGSAFGSPVARVQGIGYIIELLARLTRTPIKEHRTSTNATLDDDERTFPLDQNLYVDATHEVVLLNVITALNLSNFAVDGPLPADRIPKHRKFRTAELAPFSGNIQFQLLSCDHTPNPQIRVIINDAVTPLTSISTCKANKHGMCDLEAFVEGQKKIVESTDWDWGCTGDWSIPQGEAWETVTGDPPEKKWSISGNW